MFCLKLYECPSLSRILAVSIFVLSLLFANDFSIDSYAKGTPLGDPPDGFEVVEIFNNLDSPAGFAFSPDGRMFICERITGDLHVAEFNSTTEAWELVTTPFYTFDVPKENGAPIRHRSSGLRDIAFDPDFASNGYVYVFYMNDSPRQNRVVRVKSSTANPNIAERESEELLIEIPYNGLASSGSHNGGAIEFGADEKLYITTGDGWNGGDIVQSLNTFTGKVLRINPDGTIPEDNPFYDQTTGVYRAIYALGLRNPYSMSRHPGTGQLFINEAGGDKKASIFIVEPGANYGHQGYTGIGIEKQEWGNGAEGAGGTLITGGAWYPAEGYWPSQYRGVYFTALWGSNGDQTGHINFLHGESNPTLSSFSSEIGQSGLKPVLTRVGPDGNLYYVLTNYESDQGRIHMLRWTGQESARSPVISPAGGTYMDPVEVTLSSSTVGAQIRYSLDGSTPDENASLYTNPILIQESVVLNARAYKEELFPSSTISATYFIGGGTNIAPVANAGEDQRVTVGDFVTLSGAGSYDPDGDDLTLSWKWVQLSGPSIELFSSEDAVAFFTPEEEGAYTFQLSVIDEQDVSTDEITIEVQSELPLDAGLISYWLLDEMEGVRAKDEVQEQEGVLINGPAWRPDGGKLGGALEFDGVDDYVDIGGMDEITGTDLTVAFWFKADDFEIHDSRFISKAKGVQDEDHFWMVSTIDDQRLRFRLKAGGATTTLVSEPGVVSPGIWHHVAATYDGARMRLYKDGSLIASLDKSGSIDNDPGVLAVLGNQPPGAGERPFDGLLDEVRIYSRALSANSVGLLASGEVILSADTPEGTQLAILNANYPNPFSRYSTIAYQIERPGYVRLEIFDMAGRRVSLLVDEHKSPGEYEVQVDAIELRSNVYMYRLIASGTTQIKLMHVLK